MTDEILFGEWLRKQRRALDLTRQALSAQVGCAEVTLRRIENGTLKPSKELALILLEKLGVPETERPKWILFARGLAGLPEKPSDSFPTKPTTNLPALLTTFIGREKEQAEILKLIRKYRLVTLTGPGGVGKTRLSIKIGEQVLGDFADGVWLAELASLDDSALLAQTVTARLGIVAQSTTPAIELLANFLRPKTLLLILDNCEHLLDACAQLADMLLQNCSNLKILATSRESLGITGEAAYPVPSLGLPDLAQLLENFREYESVRLFEERAGLAKTDFALALENANSIAQICRRLDGVPLAIELAAAHVNMLTTEQIAAQLNESFGLLTGGSRTALPRQQTIRASIEWSWNLLSDSERILLRRLSVFAGGWTLEISESVCGGDNVIQLTTQLVAKSLVVTNRESAHERRYHLLETIRQHAHEKLVDAGEEERLRAQHLKYFLDFSEQAEPELHGPQQIEWLRRIGNERDNFRAALAWALETDVEAGLYLSSRLERYWDIFDIREGAHWVTEFLQNPASKNYPRARAMALCMQGGFEHYIEEVSSDRSTLEESLMLYRSIGDQQGETDVLLMLADVSTGLEKGGFGQQALALSESLGDGWRQALALRQLGLGKGRAQRFAYWERSIALFRESGDWRILAHLLGAFGHLLVLAGEFDSAQKYLEESNALFQRLNFSEGKSALFAAFSRLAVMRGDYVQARAYLQKDIADSDELGIHRAGLWPLARLGHLALREGNVTEARELLTQTVSEFQKLNSRLGLFFSLEGIASLCVLIGKPERAPRLIGCATAIREQIGERRWLLEQQDVDRDIAAIIAKIGKAAFEEAYKEGLAMTLDEAVVYALEGIQLQGTA